MRRSSWPSCGLASECGFQNCIAAILAARPDATASASTSTGTDVTTVFGRYSRRALRANADWLCSHCVFHCVTNSGMTTVITSSGLSASSSSRYSSTGWVSSRYGEEIVCSGIGIPNSVHASVSRSCSSSSVTTDTAMQPLRRQRLGVAHGLDHAPVHRADEHDDEVGPAQRRVPLARR